VAKRTAKEAEATRRLLIRRARKLFAKRGYASVSIDDLLEKTGLTRGALYHHFDGKAALFRAVVDAVEAEIAARALAAAAPEPPEKHLEAGLSALLDAVTEHEVRQIVLIDAPAVLGWEARRELDSSYAIGLLETALAAAMEVGYIVQQPVTPLAHLLMGSLNEAGTFIAAADDTQAARKEIGAALARVIDGLKPRSGTPRRARR
jgi:AcrR family transcriptional regulator